MMFLVIFGSLAAAMAIVSQGNLRTADSHLKINRSLAAAETGLNLMVYRLNQVTQGDPSDPDRFPGVYTTAGLIHDGNSFDPTGNAHGLWVQIADATATALSTDSHYTGMSVPYTDVALGNNVNGRPIVRLNVPAIQIGDGGPVFSATLIPHPLPLDEQPSDLGYDDPKYDRPPYDGSDPSSGIDWDVSEAEPLDGRFIHVKVTAYDGDLNDPSHHARGRVYRSVSADFRLGKTIPYAVLSRSRLMIGRNVMIKGNVGSRFTEVDKINGHPVQVQSDFVGLSDSLDDVIAPPGASVDGGGWFHKELLMNDINGDNRLNLAHASEVQDLPNPEMYDADGDGYISDFDFFLLEFDDNGDGKVITTELAGANDGVTATQLFELMDAAGDAGRPGYGDGYIDGDDRYSKIRGEISTLASADDWQAGVDDWGDNGTATAGDYRDYLQGAVRPDHGRAPLKMQDPDLLIHDFDQHSFDTSGFRAMTVGTVDAQAGIAHGGASPEYVAPGSGTREEVPFGAAYPYDYYERPVYRNMVFEDVLIPVGTNALFENCRFIGVTYIEVEPDNGDNNFNYVGMQESDGSPKHPDYGAEVAGSTVGTTKPHGNNLRFHGCTFEGAVVSGGGDGSQPENFTHVRNKLTFTGNTSFDLSAVGDEEDRELYRRSQLLLPHLSVEMGSFSEAYGSTQKLELSGAVVAGLIDMRGQVEINGTLITTFQPISGEAPVLGDTSPQFNTTLGYFSQGQGDLEAELPDSGLGKIRLSYDPTLALPDGINGPIELRPIMGTYTEGGR